MAKMDSESEDDKPLSFRKKQKKEIKKKRKKQDSDFEDEEDEEDFKQARFILILYFLKINCLDKQWTSKLFVICNPILIPFMNDRF